MSNYSELNKDELLELARERDLPGRSGLNKDELVAALEAQDQGTSDSLELEREYQEEYVPERQKEEEEAKEEGFPLGEVGYQSEASDPENPYVADKLEGKPAYEDLSEHDRELADLALDVSGPLGVQSPYERIMTGAVDEEQAKQQVKERAKLHDDFTGDLTERVSDEDAERVNKAFEERDEDATAPNNSDEGEPPLIEQYKQRGEKYAKLLARYSDNRKVDDVEERTIRETQGEEKERVGQGRVWAQRAQIDTTGLGGVAADRLDRAYRTADVRSGQSQATFHAEDPKKTLLKDSDSDEE